LASRLLVALLLPLVLGYVGYLAIALGPAFWTLTFEAWLRGEERILQPAERRGAPLRTAQGGADRVYLLTTQQERVVPLRWTRRGGGMGRARAMLHVDLWAFDAATVTPAWRKRLRTFEDRGRLTFQLLGADGGTLWLFVREPIGVALADGAILADGARLETTNPALAGKRVDQDGYVAFGAQGLQLTLSDATQWVVAGDTLRAAPRAAAPHLRDGIVVPAPEPASTDRFQLRGLPVGTRWLGVLTADEAATLQAEPVVPGAQPGERRGGAADFFARQHVPGDLVPQPRPYRLWSAKVSRVSAAPRDWPKELPDNWGTREQFSDYAALPEAPPFLLAGLLGDGRSERPFWLRDPDSVLVLHHDKVGDAGRLRLARVAGPAGRVVWDAALPLADLAAAFHGNHAGNHAGERGLAIVGSLPNPAYDPKSEVSREEHELLVAIDVASGGVASFDLTEASTRETDATVGGGP
jgi:hypothetical protein